MTIDEMIAVLQAAKEGKAIQSRVSAAFPWRDCGPLQDLDGVEYRVKPEPREWWVNIYPKDTSRLLESKIEANTVGAGRIECVHVREVID